MKQLIKRSSLVGVLCCLLAFNSKAVIDLGEIELGKVYDIPGFAQVVGTFTAPSTGNLIQDGVPDIKIAGMDGEYVGWGTYGQVYTYSVTEGTEYSIVAGFVMQAGKVCWNMEGAAELTVKSVEPSEGQRLASTTNYIGDVLIKFNEPVNAAAATLSSANGAADASITQQGDMTLVVNVKNALSTLFSAGALNPAGGDNLTLAITGITTLNGTQYNGDGTLTLHYVSAPKSLSLISTNVTNGMPLKSYYPVGSSEGLLEFTFDGNVASGVSFVIAAGNPEVEGGYYYEEIPAKNTGAKVTVDLQGKLRDLNAYVDADKYVEVKLGNVRDTEGFYAEGNGEGNLGSYSYTFDYEYIEPVVISSEFTPPSGSSIKGLDQIEIWLNNADKIRFSGIQFACPEATVVVPLNQLEIAREQNDLTILVDIPEAIKGKDNVTVTLADLISLDGYDHSREVSATYDAFVATLVSPIQDGKAYASTGDDDFVFTFNEAFDYIRYDFYNGDEWVYGAQINPVGDGTYTSYNGNYQLYKGVDNRMLVRCYNLEEDYWKGAAELAKAEFHFIGLTQGFTYSEVKFVSIDPEPNTVITITDDFCFTVTFDGLATIGEQTCVNMGMGTSSPFAKIEAVDPEELTGMSSVWKLYPSAAETNASGIDISIFAYDEYGKLIEGNMGGDEYDFLQFSWTIDNPADYVNLMSDPDDGSEVEALNSIQLYYPGQAVGINYNYFGEWIQLTDKAGDVVYTFTDSDIELVSPDGGEITVAVLKIGTTLSVGEYTLTVPKRFFILGSQSETYYNAEFSATYTVKEGAGIESITIDAIGSDIYDLNGRKVSTERILPGIYITNGKKILVK